MHPVTGRVTHRVRLSPVTGPGMHAVTLVVADQTLHLCPVLTGFPVMPLRPKPLLGHSRQRRIEVISKRQTQAL